MLTDMAYSGGRIAASGLQAAGAHVVDLADAAVVTADVRQRAGRQYRRAGLIAVRHLAGGELGAVRVPAALVETVDIADVGGGPRRGRSVQWRVRELFSSCLSGWHPSQDECVLSELELVRPGAGRSRRRSPRGTARPRAGCGHRPCPSVTGAAGRRLSGSTPSGMPTATAISDRTRSSSSRSAVTRSTALRAVASSRACLSIVAVSWSRHAPAASA